MLCPAVLPKDTVGPQSGDPMPRRLDHLVICVRDLAQAALDWQTLGFSLTPTGVHPFGTSNRLAMFGNNFLELLAVTDPAAVPPPAPDRFSFAAHNRDFLASAEGMSMLAMHSTDAHADAARFKAHHIGAYAPFDFGRDAVLPAEARRASNFHWPSPPIRRCPGSRSSPASSATRQNCSGSQSISATPTAPCA
jgi:hypothetical protein